jgi:hypothetical protein
MGRDYLLSVVRANLFSMIINCDSCSMRNIACDDCVVTAVLNITPLPGKTAEFSKEDQRAINQLASAGLIPPLRYRKGGKYGLDGRKIG